ncbi:MAG: LPS assembly lipoprotein LptE [Gammaproteobacteria bacterium]|nr:LPS assembly lipoprotein LptE [Gammaproteobacteria bacterium]
MRVTMSGGQAYPPLLTEVRRALLVLGSVRLTEDVSAAVPVLTLYSEVFQNEVLSLDSSGRINSYLLNYRASYSLADGKGNTLLPKQSVKLQREFSFDRLNVIATEKQGEFLQTEMRRDAAQQILRQLASLNLAKPDTARAAQP